MARLPNLDKLRGFAALSVLLYHVIEHTGWTGYPISGPLAWGRIGWLGVDLFFVLSGLVIVYSAWSLRQSDERNWRDAFWRRRMRRILPLYLLTGLLFVLIFLPVKVWPPYGWLAQHALAHLAFVHNLFRDTHGSINGVNWTIGVEMQFYLLVALALPWLMKARISAVALVFCLCAWSWRAAIFALYGKDADALFHLTTQLPGTLDLFFTGILICKLVIDPRYAHVMERLRRHYVLLLACAAVAAAAMWRAFWQVEHYWQNPASVIFFKSVVGVAAFSIVTAAILCPWRLPRPLSRPLDLLGEWSYGIYLWHLPVILLLKEAGLGPGVPFLAAAVAVTITLAAASYHLFEQRWMRETRPEPRLGLNQPYQPRQP